MKKYIIFLLIISSLLLFLLYIIFLRDKRIEVSQLPREGGILTWQELTPSISTKEDAINILGEPETSFVSEEDNLFCMYWTAEEKVEIGMNSKNSVCVFKTTERIGYINLADPRYFYVLGEDDLIKNFCKPSRKMKSAHSRDSWIYIYATEGFAYSLISPIDEGDGRSAEIISKYIFEPMSQEEFDNTFKWRDSDIIWEE